jgi:hypothetical protein
MEAILEVEKQSKFLEEVAGWTESIRGANQKIADRIRKTREALERQVTVLNECTEALRDALGAAKA